jgi:hypothetical protein
MPDRLIVDRARTSPTLDRLSAEEERLFWRLLTVADDDGQFDADPRAVLAAAFPLRVGRWTPQTVARWLGGLVAARLITIREDGDRQIGTFVSWRRYQRPIPSVRPPRRPIVSPVTLGDQGFVVPPDLVARWKAAYPAVDVEAELRAAYEWQAANPARRKSNWARFLVNWLKRAQDRASAFPRGGHQPLPPPSPPPPPPPPAAPEVAERYRQQMRDVLRRARGPLAPTLATTVQEETP